MRALLRRYGQLTVQQKRLYSALTVLTMVALLLYCLGIGSFLLRSRLVSETAMEIPPTFTASPTPLPTSVATPQSTSTPTATLPPTPTQRPIPTFTPTPESVNVTVVITSTDGVTSTTVISATVTPTATFTPTITTTAEASTTLPATETTAPLVGGSTPPSVNESGCYAQLSPGPSYEIARHSTPLWSPRDRIAPSALLTDAYFPQPASCESTPPTLRYG
jgi:hypothetical protein